MKDFSYYTGTALRYPLKKEYTRYYFYEKGECLKKMMATEYDALPDEEKDRLDRMTRETVVEKDTYDRALVAYHAERKRRHEEFKKDLFEDLGIENHMKREVLFSMAWDRGHDSGYEEVYNEAYDLHDLLD